MKNSPYARGSSQYQKRPKPPFKHPDLDLEAEPKWEDVGFRFSAGQIDLSHIKQRSVEVALARMQVAIPDHVWNAAALEGNTYTIVEVRTLLDNVTVGGRSLHDTEQILALRDSFGALDTLVRSGTFALDEATSSRLHHLVGRHEARDAGIVRGQGQVSGGGIVRLTDGTRVDGVPTELLPARFRALVDMCTSMEDVRLAALTWCAGATRNQFYFDANKRTSRLVASGMLLSAGFDAIRVPVAAKFEYNHALDTLFMTDDATEFMAFLASTFG